MMTGYCRKIKIQNIEAEFANYGKKKVAFPLRFIIIVSEC